jgi:hypothetical protein
MLGLDPSICCTGNPGLFDVVHADGDPRVEPEDDDGE